MIDNQSINPTDFGNSPISPLQHYDVLREMSHHFFSLAPSSCQITLSSVQISKYAKTLTQDDKNGKPTVSTVLK